MNEESRQIEHLKRIFDSLERYWNSIQLLLGHVSKPLLVDDRGLANTLRGLKETLEKVVEEVKVLDITQTLGEIKFIGKKLHQIEADIEEIKKDGLKKKIDLNFSCDGYEMVKIQNEAISSKTKEILLNELLSTLQQQHSNIIIQRFGLLGKKSKTYVEIGKMMDLSASRVRIIYLQAIRKLRHPSRKMLVKGCMHKELIKQVLGED